MPTTAASSTPRTHRGPRRVVPRRAHQGVLGRCRGRDGPALDGRRAPARRERFRVTWFLDPSEPRGRPAGPTASPSPTGCASTCPATARSAPTFTADARPVNVGRTQRDIPERTRRLVIHRDKKVPGARGAPRPAGCRSTTSTTAATAVRSDTPQPRRPVPGRPPPAPPGPARHQRRRRRPRRADVHRRPRRRHRPCRQTDATDQAAAPTEGALRAPAGRAHAALVDHVPRPAAPGRRRRRLNRGDQDRVSAGQLGSSPAGRRW